MIELSAADGRVLARRTVPGTAYGVAAVGKTLYVTRARKSAVAELDADTLAPLATVPALHGPRTIYAAVSQVWVEFMLAHQLVPIGASAGRPIWLSIQDAWISSNAGLLAVQGNGAGVCAVTRQPANQGSDTATRHRIAGCPEERIGYRRIRLGRNRQVWTGEIMKCLTRSSALITTRTSC